jgi:hypothetical protein
MLKKKLNSFFFKIIFFKIIFLPGQKSLILVNCYKIIKRITNSNRRGPLKKDPGKDRTAVEPSRLKSNRRGTFNRFLVTKPYRKNNFGTKQKQRPRLSKGSFSLSRLGLVFFNFRLERFLVRLLRFPVQVRLKNIFSLKNKNVLLQKRVSVLILCRAIYKKAKVFWRLKRFLYLKDCINVLNLAFFYQKSELLANYLADIVRLRRSFFFELRTLKRLLPYFKKQYFLIYGASLKINVLGKLFGQRKRRFRCLSLKEGLRFSTQDVHVNLSYSLVQT